VPRRGDPTSAWGRSLAAFLALALTGWALANVWNNALAKGVMAYPPLPAEAGTHRLLALPPPVAGTSYRFLRVHPDGSPVTYDSCRPIHYVISSHHLPFYGEVMIQRAVAAASAASGLMFVYDGRTDERLDFERPMVQKARYGDRWAPVLIAFSDATETPALGQNVMGLGGSRTVVPHGPASERYVTGTVGVDQGDFDQTMAQWSNGFDKDRAAIMHELGHVLGLAHVENPRELMSAQNHGEVDYGPGDRHGLALEGSGLCHHDT
jgi:hypothetical protein